MREDGARLDAVKAIAGALRRGGSMWQVVPVAAERLGDAEIEKVLAEGSADWAG